MGTHNRLLGIGSARFPRSYLEIVAIDPEAPPPARPRWFELDTAAIRQAIAAGPRLVQWVARSAAIEAGVAFLRASGHEPGAVVAAERLTPRGLLRWRITLRDDGRRMAGGAVPLLIEWDDAHPCDALPPSGVALERVELGGVPARFAGQLGAEAASPRPGRPPGHVPAVVALLATPRGPVELASPWIAAA
jgi:hypothetical protein